MENTFILQASQFLVQNGFQQVYLDETGEYFSFHHHVVALFPLSKLEEINSSFYFPDLKKKFRATDQNLIFIWEDRWIQQSEQIKIRLNTLRGNFQKIHARKTSFKKVDRYTEKEFLEKNHCNLFTSMPNRYGLYLNDELVALTSFDRPRKWQKESGLYISAELIRFASKQGYIVPGGLSKLIKHAEELLTPHDIMTYIDLDWSDGRGFKQIGFEEISETGGLRFYVNPVTMDRIRSSLYKEEEHRDWIPVYNCGNLKLVKKILNSKF